MTQLRLYINTRGWLSVGLAILARMWWDARAAQRSRGSGDLPLDGHGDPGRQVGGATPDSRGSSPNYLRARHRVCRAALLRLTRLRERRGGLPLGSTRWSCVVARVAHDQSRRRFEVD